MIRMTMAVLFGLVLVLPAKAQERLSIEAGTQVTSVTRTFDFPSEAPAYTSKRKDIYSVRETVIRMTGRVTDILKVRAEASFGNPAEATTILRNATGPSSYSTWSQTTGAAFSAQDWTATLLGEIVLAPHASALAGYIRESRAAHNELDTIGAGVVNGVPTAGDLHVNMDDRTTYSDAVVGGRTDWTFGRTTIGGQALYAPLFRESASRTNDYRGVITLRENLAGATDASGVWLAAELHRSFSKGFEIGAGYTWSRRDSMGGNLLDQETQARYPERLSSHTLSLALKKNW